MSRQSATLGRPAALERTQTRTWWTGLIDTCSSVELLSRIASLRDLRSQAPSATRSAYTGCLYSASQRVEYLRVLAAQPQQPMM